MRKDIFITFLLAVLVSINLNFISVNAAGKTDKQLYQEAITKTANAISLKTQKAINEARTAINYLKGTSESKAISGLSQQVDKIQQVILTKIINSISKARVSLKQSDIDAARASFGTDLPGQWRNTFVSDIDSLQQKLMNKVSDAITTANNSRLKADIDKANTLIADVKSSINPTISLWADSIKSKLISTPGYNIERIYSGITTSKGRYANSINIKVDKSQLPEGMRNFTQMDGESDFVSIESSIKHAQDRASNVRNYDNQNGYDVFFYSPGDSVLIVLYDDNISPLGYYILNPIEYNVDEITSGVSVIYEKNFDFTVMIDRNKLPENMKNFAKGRVASLDSPWDKIAIDNDIKESQIKKYGVRAYDDKNGYECAGNSKFRYPLLLLFDDKMNPLGYYVLPIR